MKFVVIDVIRFNEVLRKHIEYVAQSYPIDGLFIILSPLSDGAGITRGQIAVIERSDGGIMRLTIDELEVRHGVLGLFFPGLDKDAIPLGAQVTLEKSLSDAG